MKFHQHINAQLGEIWIADATANSFVKAETESRQEFEARFLHVMLGNIMESAELSHESSGAPILKNHPNVNISISHSENWFALYLSEKQRIGVDIETQHTRIEKTQHYFLSKAEIDELQPSRDQLKICWGIKEAVFKQFRGEINSLKDEVQIASIDENQAQAICNTKKINLKFLQNKSFTLVYTG